MHILIKSANRKQTNRMDGMNGIENRTKVNGKLETLLNLALALTEEERMRSTTLSVGYNASEKTWELIVKYNGDIGQLRAAGIRVEELIAGYAIVEIKEQLIEAFSDLDEIEYIEMPKRLFFSSIEDKKASCSLCFSARPPYLSGQGVLVAIIDSGIDYAGLEFRKKDGSSRILYLWDQTLTPESVNAMASPDTADAVVPPEGFQTGVEFNKARIDAALGMPTAADTYHLVPSRDNSGHGTSVTAIAAATGVLENGRYTGMAPDSSLIIVKLGFPGPDSFPRTTELMRALTYVARKAVSLGMPIAINISFGNTYGAHDGTSLLERFISNISQIGRNVICIGSGNEGAAGGHIGGQFGYIPIGSIVQTRRIELSIAKYQQNLSVQLWKEFTDHYQVTLISPSGHQQPINTAISGKKTIAIDNTEIFIFIGEPSPHSIRQEIYFDFIPRSTYVDFGIWIFAITPVKTVVGNYDLYLPSSGILNAGTGFFTSSPEKTLTIPSTAAKVITVGSYDITYESYADFSGRGNIFQNLPEAGISSEKVKPDLVAPGVNIRTVATGNRPTVVSGSSFAAPFAAGAAALIMEWGIIQGNDPFLYGEKVKAYMRSGARSIPGESEYPNSRIGYGALCVENSLPL